MTEIDAQGIFKEMNLSRILVATLQTFGTISIPALTFLDAAKEDKQLQVDYDSTTESFTFKLKEIDNEQSDNNTNVEEL
jgi:hypothetical protein